MESKDSKNPTYLDIYIGAHVKMVATRELANYTNQVFYTILIYSYICNIYTKANTFMYTYREASYAFRQYIILIMAM